METISSYEARTRFGDLVNRVYYGGTPIVIERYGTPLVKITRIEPSKRRKVDATKATKKKTNLSKKEALDRIMKFAGILSDEDAKIFTKVYKESRSEHAREIPLLEF